MSWVAKTTPTRIAELADELKYVREYISQLPTNTGALNIDSAGMGRRGATANRIGPVKGIWAFHPAEVRRYHEEPIASFMDEDPVPIFLNALEIRAASQIVNPQTDEDLIPIRQFVTATNDGQLLFVTPKNGRILRLLKPGSPDKDGVLDIKDVATDFVPDELVTGLTSGATCKVDFIQFDGQPGELPTGERKLWFRELTGSFIADEDIGGDIAGSAKAKESEFFDTSGNINLGENVDINQNVELLFKFNSNAPIPTSPEGSWIAIGGEVTTTAGGGATEFPILFPVDDKGDVDGTTTVAVDLSVATAHTTRMKLVEDPNNTGVSITQLISFTNPPPVGKSIVFYMTVEQDDLGGHTLDFTDTFINVPLIQTGANKITNIGFITTDGGETFDSFVFGQTLGDNLGNHIATQDLEMETFNIMDVDVLRYADPGKPGQDGVIGFNVFGSSVEKDTFTEFMKWSIPARETGIRRHYEWQVDLAPIMRLEHESNTGFSLLDMLNGTIANTQGISFIHINESTLSNITPKGLELEYVNGIPSGGGGFHGFRVANPQFPQFEIREDFVKTDVDFNMSTNDILEIDRARFDQNGGFDSVNDKDDRLISGGAEGMILNIPKKSPFAGGFHLYFENDAETESEKEYSFEKGQFRMFRNEVSDTLGILFSNGGVIADLNSHIQFDGGVNSNAIDPQTLKFGAKDSGFTTIDMFELTGTEHNTTNAGGMKMFTDLNLQTQDLTNVDRIHFNSNQGIVGGNQVAISGFGDDMQLNVPPFNEFTFRFNDELVGRLSAGTLRMNRNSVVFNPSIISDGSFIVGDVHTEGTTGMVDGEHRLIDDLAGSFDVIFRTGGDLVNLSTLAGGGTSFIGFDADDDLRMNTFNIEEVDVLRYAVDSGVIGFNVYGSAVEPDGSKLKWSVPPNKGYEWQVDLEGVADLTAVRFRMLSNSQSFSPSIISDGAFIIGQEHILGDAGIIDGEHRLVNDGAGSIDVIFGSGGNLVNLTTLAAGNAGYSFVQNEGNPVVQQNTLNFIGAGVTASDDPSNNRTNIDITAGSGAQQLDELTDVDITFPQDDDEGIFFSSITNTYTNRKIVNAMLDAGAGGLGTIFSSISGLAIQQQDLDMGGFAIINSSGGAGDGANRNLSNLLSTSVNDSIIPNGDPNINLGSITFKWQDTFTNTLFVQDTTTLAVGHIMDGNLIPTTGKTVGGTGGGEQYQEVHGRKYFTDPATALDTGFTGMQQVGSSLTLVSANNDIIFYGQGSLRMRIDSSADTIFMQQQNVADINTLSAEDFILGVGGSSGVLQFNTHTGGLSQNGSMAFDGTDIIAISGNNLVNLSDIGTGGGGNFVTVDTTQTVSGAKTWTAGQLFTNAVTMTSSVQLGDSSSDLLLANGRWLTSLIPNNTGVNLGQSSPRWGTVFANTLDLQFGADVNNITTNSGTNNNSSIMTSAAIQNLVSTSGGGVTEDQPFVNWTGTHVFNGTFTTIGNSASDVLQINARVNSSIIPVNQGNDLGQSGNRWDIFGRELNLLFGSTVNNISNSSGASGFSMLMTAQAIQNAISAGGGGSFVTTNTTQTGLSGSKTWTGGHVFTNVVSFDNSVTLGNGISDFIISNGRYATNIIPTNTGLNLGDSSRRWDLFGSQMSLSGGSTVNFISTSQSSNSNSSLMTSAAIQDAIDAGSGGGGSFVTTNTTQTVSGTKTFTSSGSRFSSNLRVDGSLEINGTFNHDGSRVGFRGRFPATIQSIPFASSAGSTSQQLASLRATANTTRAVLITQGLAS